MRLEEILKARGWTDEDIAAQKTILDNPKWRLALEEEYGALSGRVSAAEAAAQAEKDNWTKWHAETAVPTIDQYQKDTVEARAEAAGWKARYDEAVKQGYAPPVTPPAGTPPVADPAAAKAAEWDAKTHKVVTYDDLSRFGHAARMSQTAVADLQEEYFVLTGNRLIDYTRTTSDGRVMRGMTALDAEAQEAKKPLAQYVAEKFDFAGKRTAADQKRRLDAEEAIRRDERAKVAAEYGNPSLRTPMPSRSPFIPPKAKEGGQPWETTGTELRNRRISSALETEAKARVQ